MCFFFDWGGKPSNTRMTPPSGELGVNLGNLTNVGQRQLKLPGQTTLPSIPLGNSGVSLGIGLPRLF